MLAEHHIIPDATTDGGAHHGRGSYGRGNHGCGEYGYDSRGQPRADAQIQASMYPNALTIDVYSDGGTYNGLQPDGWFANAVQNEFNMKLNIIGGQSASGDTIYQTRSAAGDLGDLIFTSNQHLSDAVKAGNLILDITDLYNTKLTAYSAQFAPAEKNLQTYLNTDKVYAVPTVVSAQSPTSPMTDGVNPQSASYMRLDIYNQIGAPAMNSLDDLLPTLQKMVAAYPKTDAGKKTYGFSLFKDWDGGGCMCCGGLFACEYGWTRFEGGNSVCFYNLRRRRDAVLPGRKRVLQEDDGAVFPGEPDGPYGPRLLRAGLEYHKRR